MGIAQIHTSLALFFKEAQNEEKLKLQLKPELEF